MSELNTQKTITYWKMGSAGIVTRVSITSEEADEFMKSVYERPDEYIAFIDPDDYQFISIVRDLTLTKVEKLVYDTAENTRTLWVLIYTKDLQSYSRSQLKNLYKHLVVFHICIDVKIQICYTRVFKILTADVIFLATKSVKWNL